MNSTGDTVSMAGMLGATGTAGGAVSGASAPAAKTSSNTLKNNEFSNVLAGQQQARFTLESTPVTAAATPAGTAQPGRGLVVNTATVSLFALDAAGNPVPQQGGVLPPGVSVLPLQEGEASALPDDGGSLAFGVNPALPTDVPSPMELQLEVDEPTAGILEPVLSPIPLSTTAENFTAHTLPGEELMSRASTALGEKSAQLLTSQTTLPGRVNANNPSIVAGLQTELPDLQPESLTAAKTASTMAAAPYASTPGLFRGQSAPTRLEALTAAPATPLTDASIATTDSATPAVTANWSVRTENPAMATAPVLHSTVPVTVGKPGWSDTVMQQVMWMSSQHISKAEIALDPPELGPLQVRITSQGDHTSVSFTSAHAVVRDALDQGLPRLRDLMESQGLNLADVDVSDQHQQRRTFAGDGNADSDDDTAPAFADNTGADPQGVDPLAPTSGIVSALGLIDHYV